VRRFALPLLLALTAAAPAPNKPPPHATPAQLAEQLAMLAFDANPAWATPPRAVLSRWAGPLRLFVFGRPEDKRAALAALAALARPTRIPASVVAEHDVARTAPNVFLVADGNLPGAFRGPLRPMLANAFLDDEAAAESFVVTVVDHMPCWVLPVWADERRLTLKAAVIGADTARPAAETRACILRGLGGAIGLLGPGAFLPGSAFAPGGSGRLSADDERMLRALYAPSLRPGMTRDQTLAAARKALAAPAHPKPPAHRK
jgi:hypothetical protein